MESDTDIVSDIFLIPPFNFVILSLNEIDSEIDLMPAFNLDNESEMEMVGSLILGLNLSLLATDYVIE
jgi:hypothetical protein